LRKFAGFATLFAFALLASLASAQQGDVALGFSALMSPGAASCSSIAGAGLCPEKGGVYPSLNVDVIFHRRIGFNYEVTWRGSQGLYGGCAECQPYRPIINDFSAIFQPRLGKKLGADLLAGIGFQDTRAYGYQPTFSCYELGACFTSSFHLVTDVGGGIRYYFWHHVFIRPEVRYYWINNNNSGNLSNGNNVSFSSGSVLRVGASLGYTIGGPE
jgi:hypothetical protein